MTGRPLLAAVVELTIGQLLCKHTAFTREAPWHPKTLVKCVRVLPTPTVDFGQGPVPIQLTILTKHFFVVVDQSELQGSDESPDIHRPQTRSSTASLGLLFTEHNRYVCTVHLTQLQGPNRLASATQAAGPVLRRVSAMSQRRQTDQYRKDYGAEVFRSTTDEELKWILLESLREGRRVFSESMCWAARKKQKVCIGAVVSEDESEVVDDSDREDSDSASDDGALPLVYPSEAVADCGVFPYSRAYRLYTVKIPYRSTVYPKGSKESDLTYLVWPYDGEPKFGNLEYCKNELRKHWRWLHSDRDFLSRMISLEPDAIRNGPWSYNGTRAHRKCYARTLLGKWPAPDEVNYTICDQLRSQGKKSPLHKLNEFVVTENGFMQLHEAEPLTWFAMYEAVTAESMRREVYGAALAPDTAVIEHFAINLRQLLHYVVHDVYNASESSEMAPEFPVYWPFGMHSKTANDPGRVYETRVDLVMSVNNKCVLIEYKTRMELGPRTIFKIYTLRSSTKDRIQLRLNAWMLYLNTGMAPDAYVLQVSRRQLIDNNNRRTVRGVAVKLGTPAAEGGAWATVGMVRLITRFAIHPYGPESVARYADAHFVIPDLSALMTGLRMVCGNGLMYERDGTHAVFSAVLLSSGFTRAVNAVIVNRPLVCVEDGLVIRLGLPDGCFSGSTLSDARVHSKFKKNVGESVKQAHRRLEKYWKDTPQQTGQDSVARSHIEMRQGGFIPVLFDATGAGLLYCNYSYQLVVDKALLGPRPSCPSNAFVPLHALPLFRRPDVGFSRRLRFGNDVQWPLQAALCEQLRRSLASAVKVATINIETRLSTAHANLHRVSGAEFWRMTLEDIRRRHVLDVASLVMLMPSKSAHPLVREFADFGTQPYAPAPKELDELAEAETLRLSRTPVLRQRDTPTLIRLRRIAILRCVHRLVNTRLLRGALALVGVSDYSPDQVCDRDQWTDADLATWKAHEQTALGRALEYDAGPGTESSDWWGAAGEEHTGRSDDHARSDCFPHFSQRAMWSRAALEAALGLVLAEDTGAGPSVLEHVTDHIAEDLCAACARHLQAL